MQKYLDMFENYLINEKKSSQNTVESYLRDLKQFVDYCAHKDIEFSLIDNAFVCSYLDSLALLGKSEASRSRAVASIRCFYKYLISQKLATSNPTGGIASKKTEKKLPGVLDSKEILLLLAQPSGNDYKSIRDKAMLELLYATGIKVSELIDITCSDLNLSIGILHLHNGKKERIVPMYPQAIKALEDYIENVRPAIVLDEGEDKLFTNMSGQPMSRQGFWKIIKFYSAKAGIDKDITPHTLRHSFAAHLLENGAKLSDIKEMLGHTDISSTQVYARLVKSKYSSAYSRFHPLAK